MPEELQPVLGPPQSDSQFTTCLRPHTLEQVFDFEDVSFRRYMEQPRHPEKLHELIPLLAESDHPVVLVAAGSAAVESALHPKTARPLSPQSSSRERMRLLNSAETYWSRALAQFSSYFQEQNDIELKDQFKFMSSQTMHKLAYIPMMKVAASLYANCPMPLAKMAAMQQKTTAKLLQVAEDTLNMSEQKVTSRADRTGLLGELACGMIGMVDDPAKYILLPSSLRQDHDIRPMYRADFISIATRWPFLKAPVQVTSFDANHKTLEKTRVTFHKGRDLALQPGLSVQDTVEGFIDMTDGRATSETTDRFAVLGRVMTQRLDLFMLDRTQGMPTLFQWANPYHTTGQLLARGRIM